MKAEEIFKILESKFKDAKCELNFENVYQLLVAVVLSAQCTDKRVNLVTPKFFEVFKDVHALARAEVCEIENLIKTCGLFHTKSANLKRLAEKIVSDYGGIVPNTREGLESLAGVGRKTASVVLAVGFGADEIAVDTHVFRVSNRIGFGKSKNVLECEKKLQAFFPKTCWTRLHYMLVLLGRYFCTAKKPKCSECEFMKECDFFKENKNVSR
ncbi:MAG: endonuclease III [Clostridia bacterium]